MLFTDFHDEIGDQATIDLIGVTPAAGMERFRAKARAFLRQHEDHITVHRLRMNKPLTPSDLQALEVMLAESGIGDAETIARAREESRGLGLFVRSLVGLDRGAAKEAFAAFLDGATHSASQVEFVNLIIDDLTEHGVIVFAREGRAGEVAGKERLRPWAQLDHPPRCPGLGGRGAPVHQGRAHDQPPIEQVHVAP